MTLVGCEGIGNKTTEDQEYPDTESFDYKAGWVEGYSAALNQTNMLYFDFEAGENYIIKFEYIDHLLGFANSIKELKKDTNRKSFIEFIDAVTNIDIMEEGFEKDVLPVIKRKLKMIPETKYISDEEGQLWRE